MIFVGLQFPVLRQRFSGYADLVQNDLVRNEDSLS